ncbi:MAG TPA: NAD(+)/NADH kinase [Steroidobacteraceae bacterium]|nr:NAD(+)/NADH kinase [Steroidobacteraceae bacterium]
MEQPAHGRTCVALAGRAVDPRVGEAMRVLAQHLLARGCSVKVAADEALDVTVDGVHTVLEPDLAMDADLVVAVGGDGTMLHAARMAALADVPVLGVNRGRLGFLADVGPEKMIESVDDALAGRCHAERRMLLAAHLHAGGHSVDALGLNDVVVTKRETGRTVDVRTWVNGAYVNTHGGDGFIVATPTGSTAYALSCGGPIVHPSLDAVVLVPVSPHTLSDRPIVVPAGSVIEIELSDRFDTRAQVACDGHVLCDLEPGVRLRIERAKVTATLLHPPGHDYYRILRSKLHWGRGTREGQPPGA